jgi:serine/threonine protein kinase/Rieske Fe-S protein
MQTLSIDQLAGQTLGNYRVERFLGQGRLNAVYLARHLAEEQRLDALTVYGVPERFSPEARLRFLLRFHKEATAVTSLDHPHILPVYDHGEVAGHPYLVTPYMMHGSLVDLLKRHGQYDHGSILPILEQLASGLAYAHDKGFVHGTLRPSTVVLSPEHALRVAGFGLMHMLQLGGLESNEQRSNTPYAHLLSIAETFLITPEYVAPEVIQSQSIDVRSDIYALGCILFELLSGHPPFTGKEPLEIIHKHVKEAVPLLHMQNPDVPIALASVVNQALERNPARRFQHVLDVIEAFRQASRGATNHSLPGTARKTRVLRPTQFLQDDTPPEIYASSKWQLVPPIVTGKQPAIRTSEKEQAFVAEMPTQSINTGPWRAVHPNLTGQLPIVTTGKVPSISPASPQEARPPVAPEQAFVADMPTQSINTGAWRAVRTSTAKQSSIMPSGKMPSVSSSTSQETKPSIAPEQAAITEMPTQSIDTGAWRAVQTSTARQSSIMPSGKMPSVSLPNLQQGNPSFTSQEQSALGSRSQASKKGDDISSLVNAYAWWSQPGIASPPEPQTKQMPQAQSEPRRETLHLTDPSVMKWGNDASMPFSFLPKSAPTPHIASRRVNRRKVVALLATGGAAVAVGAVALNLGTLQHLLGMAPNQSGTAGKLVQSQTGTNDDPQMHGHLGTVIGHTSMALNSATSFTNPTDGQGSLLIHLPNNKFVAYERACTHEQVAVYYDPTTKQLVCPAHNAIFDPAGGGAVVQGPATKPLPRVKISVNSDGTITVM